jgi:hypothetical protein
VAGALGFLAEGFREVGRKSNRAGLRRQLAAKARERQQALTNLGQTAWQAKIDLSDLADLRSQLEQLDAKAGDLAAAVTKLDADRTALEARRKAEVARFDALLAPAKSAQAAADAALKAARAVLAEKDHAIRAIEARRASLVKDLAKLAEKPAAPPAQPGAGAAVPGATGPAERARIEAEQGTLAGQAAAEAAARVPLAATVDARAADSQRCAAETARIESEYKAALQPLDADLGRVRQASAAATSDRATVGRDQMVRFRDLGTALYDRHSAEPALAEATRAVAAIDQGCAATQAAIDASFELTRSMPPGTMPKFVALVLILPLSLALAAAAYVSYSRRSASEDPVASATPVPGSAGTERAARAGAAPGSVVADERRKDDVVQAFTKARTDKEHRQEAIDILEADLNSLGSSADRSSLPLLVMVLEKGEPELRAAAARAIGMLGPTVAEGPLLVKALNDPMPTVRESVLHALSEVPDPRTRLLVQRVQSGARDRSRSRTEGLTATVAPDAARLGAPLYPGATFLAFASDLDVGRAAFSSADPLEKVVAFYAKSASGRPPAAGEEFTRLYFGGGPGDPSGVKAQSVDYEAWIKKAMASGMKSGDFQAEADRRGAVLMNLPLTRYAEPAIYGTPTFIATEVTSSGGATRAVCWVVVFDDHTLGRTGFEVHFPARR